MIPHAIAASVDWRNRIRDADVANMMILENPAEAIDLYCEHVLLRREGRFDFRPWAVSFRAP